jgi:hypothetical protein
VQKYVPPSTRARRYRIASLRFHDTMSGFVPHPQPTVLILPATPRSAQASANPCAAASLFCPGNKEQCRQRRWFCQT